ncbi:Pathogenesis-related protein 1A1 [Bienertia sinuspersici]
MHHFNHKTLSTHAQDDQKQYLDTHNNARAEVGAAPLAWNQTLATYAQGLADQYKQKCENIESSGGPYGENTAAGYSAGSIVQAVGQWLSEKANYDPQLGDCLKDKQCKHYKQVVWKETTQIGCASAICGGGWPFVVCEYFPPAGNAPGPKA